MSPVTTHRHTEVAEPVPVDRGAAALDDITAPLAGIRVLDLSSPVGPYCGRLLGELGAEVTLIEPPEGDPYRHLEPYLTTPYQRSGGDPSIGDLPASDLPANEPSLGDLPVSLTYAYYHAGKHSVTLDLSVLAHQEQLRNLAAEVDVILIAPKGLQPLWGFSVDTKELSWAPSKAIVCSITPFGVGGPYWYRPYTHFTSFAQGGHMAPTGEAGSPPLALPAEIQWHLAATHGAVAVLGALAIRDTAGGQFLDISAQEMEAFQTSAVSSYHAQGLISSQREGGYVVPPSGVWDCVDGRVDIAAYAERHWPAFLQMLDNPTELSEPSLADMAIRRQIYDGLIPLISQIIAPYKREELFEKGQRFGLPICLRNTPAEFVADAQLRERNYWKQIIAPNGTAFASPGAPVHSSQPLFKSSNAHQSSTQSSNAPNPAASHSEGATACSASDTPSAESATASQDLPKTAPLEGFRVLSLGTFVAGNVCAQILAGLGAEVVKVERPSRPDSLRDAGFNDAHKLAIEPSGASNTPMHAQLTRGLKNLGLDLSTPKGLETFKQLVGGCDVLIENFGGSVMANWGATFEDLLAHNPKLIMVSMSGYGRTGSRATYKAYASNIATHTGLDEVWWTSGILTDYATAAHAALAVQAARIQVAKTEKPVYIDAAQTEVFAAMAARIYLDSLVNGTETQLRTNYSAESLLTHVASCQGKDRWAIVEIQNVAQWNATCDLLGCLHLELTSPTANDADTRLASSTQLADAAPITSPNKAHAEGLAAAINEWAATRTARSVAHVLTEIGVPAASVANPEEIYDDPQLRSRGYLEHVQHPDLGHLVLPAPPHRMSVTPSRYTVESARVGEHSREVLQAWAGLSDNQIQELIAAEVVLVANPT